MSESKRLFFGIGLDISTRQHIEAWLAASVIANKPSTKASNWHLTLAFLPDVTPIQQQELSNFARTLNTQPFTLHFSETGYWAHNGIFYLKPEQLPAQLLALAEPLRNKGAEMGVYDNPYGFSPHITLYRNHKPIPQVQHKVPPFSIRVNEFFLYHSYRTEADGLTYQPIEQFQLHKQL